MLHMHQRQSRFELFIYYAVAFLLLWEWLRPLQDFTETSHTSYFIIFIGLTCLFTFFRLKWYVTFPICAGLILLALYLIFYQSEPSYLPALFADIKDNISLMSMGMWSDMYPSFRTLLFYILLWLLVYLLHYWVVYQQRIFFFLLMTIVYVTILDTFTPYDATFAIVRIMVFGFCLLGLLYFDRLRSAEGVRVSQKARLNWFLPMLALVLVSASLGASLPKSDPKWPDPVPFFKAVTNQDGSAGQNKVGYSADDSSLGGPFSEDRTPVFKWSGKEPSYFRVETKSIYTGKGWEDASNDTKPTRLKGSDVPNRWFTNLVKTEEHETRVDMESNYRFNHAVYPIGTVMLTPMENIPLQMMGKTEKIVPSTQNPPKNLGNYRVSFLSPTFILEDLQRIKVPTKQQVNQQVGREYLQLPSSLPERVKTLANSLTETKDNMYDKAKAIEDYLGSAKFSYETQNVAVPGRNEDYVDQFLFDTMIGYCDNFSTSMIVMLRSIGIPARWVKGYTSGQLYETQMDGSNVYEVTNNNAHSWVEVYFPNRGWVTFEPTKGFTNPETFTNETTANNDQTDDQEDEKDQPASDEQENEQTQQPQQQEPEQAAKQEEQAAKAKPSMVHVGSILGYAAGAIVLLGFIGWVLYRFRARWLPIFIVRKVKRLPDEEAFFYAYAALLKQLRRRGIEKKPGMTLREFASLIDDKEGNHHMSELTQFYERALYRREDASALWQQSAKLWENLINRR
ncbi:transglutaminase TgpA family protein [Bacillus altitudinis]|uniref:transglutaminase TgpA family protein n=1 Tax=Bacillus altitudinis TaxID=293387 RepID=UPI002941DABA|nr:transglutaminaseTgpA domain-containing protein [Bacillus altitudinis]WOI41938.1 transglutaminaseTgpA domain-containing protein [Bacillus altitudinis]